MNTAIADHSLWRFPLIGSVHSDTIVTTWIVMVLTWAFFFWLGKSYRGPRVTSTEASFEKLISYLSDLTASTIGKQGEPFVPVFVGMFIFIWILDEFGLLPLRALGWSFGGSPTADLNTTAAFALTVYLGIWFVAIRKRGLAAFGHLARPFAALLPINIIEELARPVVLAMRLAFNIMAGDLLLFVVATIIGANVIVGQLHLSVVASIVPFGVEFFNFFIGTIQAFVFTLLTIVYFSLTVSDEGY